MSGAFLLQTLIRKLIHSTSQLTASIGNYCADTVSITVESACTESTTTSVESAVDVSVVVVVTLLQDTKTVATKANTKNTFFMIFVFIVNNLGYNI
jgi:hypothetical protein